MVDGEKLSFVKSKLSTDFRAKLSAKNTENWKKFKRDASNEDSGPFSIFLTKKFDF